MRETLLVIAAALIAFGYSVFGSFHFDDYALFSDPAIASPNGWLEVWRPIQTRPLTYFTFWLNYQTGEANPLPFHLMNLGLHIACSVLLFRVVRSLTTKRVAFIAALLFAVHPVQTEPVAYVFARGTLLCTLLSLAALASWLSASPWLSLACFAAALLAKEECVAFPLLLLALWAQSGPRNKRSLIPIAAMLLLSLAAGLRVVYAATQLRGAGVASEAGVAPLDYLSLQGVAILRYLRLVLVPWGFTADTTIEAGPLVRIICWVAVLGAAALAIHWSARLGAGFWFLAGLVLLLPSSSVFPAADLAVDRRMYLPMIAFTVAIAMLIHRWRPEIIAVTLAALCLISIQYSNIWRNERSLWSEAIARSPTKVRPRIQLARAVPPTEALAILADAQRIAPADPNVASEQGRVFLEAGNPAAALGAFSRALANSPSDASAINNRGVALLALGQQTAAQADFERALGVNPCLFDARLNLERLGGTPPQVPCRFTPEQAAALRTR